MQLIDVFCVCLPKTNSNNWPRALESWTHELHFSNLFGWCHCILYGNFASSSLKPLSAINRCVQLLREDNFMIGVHHSTYTETLPYVGNESLNPFRTMFINSIVESICCSLSISCRAAGSVA